MPLFLVNVRRHSDVTVSIEAGSAQEAAERVANEQLAIHGGSVRAAVTDGNVSCRVSLPSVSEESVLEAT